MPSVARVVVDVPLPHLDREFDYAIPASLADAAIPGVRVKVRFAGRLVGGYLVGLADDSEHRLQPLASVVSPVPALAPEVYRLSRAVADRMGGSVIDVLRAAVPPRHARAEAAWLAAPDQPAERATVTGHGPWSDYAGGSAYVDHLVRGDAPRAVWNAIPARSPWPAMAHALVSADGGALAVVPDQRDLLRLKAALLDVVPADEIAVLSADLGPSRRYAAFLDVLQGRRRIVIGTRAAAFAPVRDLRLVVAWDDGDESMLDPHAPYWHVRDVLALRAHQQGCAFLLGGVARSTDAQALVDSGWAKGLSPSKPLLRTSMPRVESAADDARDGDAARARLPRRAWEAINAGLQRGPVLVSVTRRDYVPGVACQRCRVLARCPDCAGPLRIAAGKRTPHCGWCGRSWAEWCCSDCGNATLRAVSIGAQRTVEELGRAFPGVPVRVSRGSEVIDDVAAAPALIVATPGVEPVADGGYAAVVILDAVSAIERPGLRSAEEAARRWFHAAALAAPGAPVVVTASAAVPAAQALMRWEPAWLASREVAVRTELGLPPATRIGALTGARAGVAEFLAAARLPEGARLLGPVAVDADRSRTLVVVPRAQGAALAEALHAASAVRSAARTSDVVEVRLDPWDIG